MRPLTAATFALLALLALVGCASPTIANADGPIASHTALLGETRHDRSLADYDRLLIVGVDERRWGSPSAAFPFLPEKNRFHEVPAGRRTIHVRVQATAHRGLPALRDAEAKFENVELDGGKAYIVNGQRSGEEFDVWIEDYRTKEHVTSAVKLKPPRVGMPNL